MPTDGTIDKLAIEVSSNAGGAAKGLSDLVGILERLEKSTGSGYARLREASGAVNDLKNSSANLNLSKLAEVGKIKVASNLGANLSSLADGIAAIPADANARLSAFDSLKGIGEVTVSRTLGNSLLLLANAAKEIPMDAGEKIRPLASLNALSGLTISKSAATNLGLLGDSITRFPVDGASKFQGLASVLLPLKGLNGMNIKTALKQLEQLPDVLALYKNLDVTGFVRQMEMLNTQLKPLAANIYRLGTAFKSLPTSMRTAGAAARSLAASNKYLNDSNVQVSRSTLNVIGKFTMLVAAGRKVINVLASCINESNSYIENMNLFQASMGAGTQAATEFGMKCQDLLGIDFGEWARNQGVFQTLITGMGMTADKASVMSQQLTQLGYDIASFYNMSTEDAMLKIQSGIAGELEPLRRIGWDLSNARMNLELTKMGIDANAESMTQAEKVALRYYLIMNQVTIVHGDMARTIASPANQLRVLKAQVTLAARAIGNLLIPALNMILPVAIAVVKAIRLLAQTIANFFGIDATFEVDYSSLDTSGIATTGDDANDAADALDEATKKAKEYKNTVMGFDELNKLNAPPEDSSGSGGEGSGNGGGIGLDLPLDTYDFLAGLTDTIGQKTDALAQKLATAFQKIIPYVTAIGAGIAAWKIASALNDLLGLELGWKRLLGIAMSAAGAVLLVWGWCDALVNGLNWDNLLMMLSGAVLLVGGLGLAFGSTGAAIGLIISGLALLSAGIIDAVNNGLNFTNVAAILVGLVATVGGLNLAFTNLGNMLKIAYVAVAGHAVTLGVLAAAIGLVVGGLALIAVGLYDAFNNGITVENIALICAGILAIGAGLALIFGWPALAVAAVVAAITAIVALVVANWEAISQFFADLWQGICDFFAPVGEWFQNCWNTICGFFQGAWDTIVGIWNGAGQWFQDNVITLIVDFWSPILAWFGNLFGSIWQTISDVFYDIGVIAQGCWTTIQLVWGIVANWFDQNIIKPVGNFFSTLWNAVSTAAKVCWNAITGVWNAVSSWFYNNVIKPVSDWFSGAWDAIKNGAQAAWNGIVTIFSAVGNFFYSIFSNAWSRVTAIFGAVGTMFGDLGSGILNGLKSIINNLISGVNYVISIPFSGLNSAINFIKGFNMAGVYPFSGLRNISAPQIPYLATGGQVMSGQLFVARENGMPELVGQMGGQATVANNEQIVDGIKQGVIEAMLSVMTLSDSGRSEGERPVEVVLRVGNDELARATYKGFKDLERRGELGMSFG